MKNNIRLAAVLSLLSLAVATPAMLAADAPATAPSHEKAPGKHGGARNRLHAMTERLGLTAEQQKEIGAILKAQAAQNDSEGADVKPTKEQRHERMEARKAMRAKIRALLTPEQQAKFDEMGKRRMDGPGGAQQPSADN